MNIKFIKYAVNYDDVVNFIYDVDDFTTKKIIEYYKNYMLGLIPKKIYRLKIFDKVVNKYLFDIYFHMFIKNNIDEDTDFYYDLDDIMINLYKKYLLIQDRRIAINRWL